MNQELISQAFEDRSKLVLAKDDVLATIEALDKGQVRVAEKIDGEWRVNTWVKQAILLYFAISETKEWDMDPYQFRDKIPLKRDLESAGVRVVFPGIARYGSFMEAGSILMPGFVNIGAHVGSGTMVDTWATVGSCAQVGRNCHLAGGVGIGGVLEPAGARPVIIEDGCFIGSRCIVVEGCHVEKECVLGANTVLTASTHIIDVSGPEPVEYRGHVPARSVVIPGTRPRQFPAGTYNLPCALIIGKRKESTDRKTSLNQALRDYGVPT